MSKPTARQGAVQRTPSGWWTIWFVVVAAALGIAGLVVFGPEAGIALPVDLLVRVGVLAAGVVASILLFTLSPSG